MEKNFKSNSRRQLLPKRPNQRTFDISINIMADEKGGVQYTYSSSLNEKGPMSNEKHAAT